MYCRCVEETEAHVHIYMWKIIYKHKDPRPMLSAQYMENHNDDDASSQNKGDTHRPRTRTISMAITPDQPGRTLQDNPLKVGVSYALVTVLPPVPIRQSKGLCMSCLPKGCPQDQAKGCLLSKPLPILINGPWVHLIIIIMKLSSRMVQQESWVLKAGNPIDL